jgi:hypothetical protein
MLCSKTINPDFFIAYQVPCVKANALHNASDVRMIVWPTRLRLVYSGRVHGALKACPCSGAKPDKHAIGVGSIEASGSNM